MTGDEHHIMKSFDSELQQLHADLARLAGLAESQLADALKALVERDDELATQVVAGDDQADRLDQHINDSILRVLALRAPVADDLRAVVTALRVSAELERIADLAANVAKRSLVLSHSADLPPVRAVVRMGQVVLTLLKRALDAYLTPDAEAAVAVWGQDQEVDDLYSSLFREILTYMMEDPRTITPCTQLMFAAKNLERIGDHATNIAEMTHYLVKGKPLREPRPKHDVSAYIGREGF